MFTINPYLRFALIFVGIVGGIALSIGYGFWYGFPFWLAGLILLIGYILLGTIAPAGKVLQTQDYDKAEKMLNLTLSPKLLYPTNKAYFYMLKGSIAMAKKDMEKSLKYLKIAESINLPSDNEKAMLQVQLANIAISKNQWNQARNHYRKMKDLKITEGSIKEQKKMLESALKNRGQIKMAQQMGMKGGQGGGKRRRPKMR